MLKRIATLIVLCLTVSLWPAQATRGRHDVEGFRHIGVLGGHAAVLVVGARVRERNRAVHQSEARPEPIAARVTPARYRGSSATRPVETFPSHRLATHIAV
jgi:hypothetical protein